VAGTASAQLTADVQAALAPAARYVALVTRANPDGTASQLLARPDVAATLTDALSQARESADAAVRDAWGDAPADPVLWHLLEDIAAQYAGPARLRTAVLAAYASVPARQFVPGHSAPGSHPSAEAAAERAAAVRRAVLGFARAVALRSRLTMEVARTAADTVRVLAQGRARVQAGEAVRKRWLARRDGKACHWCQSLNGVTVGMDDSFLPHLAGPADLTGHGRLTQPPRPYRGMLHGPPLHPHCRCRLMVVTSVPPEPPGEEPARAQGAGFITAAQIRSMPEAKYKGLVAFLRAALHELGQVIGALVSRS